MLRHDGGRIDNGTVLFVRKRIDVFSSVYEFFSIAVDTANYQLLLATFGNVILVFGRTDTGSVTAASSISGDSTGLSGQYGTALWKSRIKNGRYVMLMTAT